MKKYLAILTLTVAITAHAGDYPDYRNSSNSPHIYSPDGEYLGNLNNNKYDPDSVSNPYGAGNPYRPDGVNNPYSPNYLRDNPNNCDY